jgi:hypothetical protein
MTMSQPTLVPTDDSGNDGLDLPHESLDLYGVLDAAYQAVTAWQGVSWSRGTTGDQLKRALSGALLRYTEGYYADGGNKTTLWKSARASCGEAASAVRLLWIDGVVPQGEAIHVRQLLSRAMRMFTRLLRPT